MKIGIVAPSGVPFAVGGAEKLWAGLLTGLNRYTSHEADLIKLPSPESTFWGLMESYRAFSRLDLAHFDLVISTKYPAWMVSHDNHCVYLQHKLRGLYDTYHLTGLPTEPGPVPRAVGALFKVMDPRPDGRADLDAFFEQLFALRDDHGIADDVFALPGPVARRVVHYLDSIALHPSRVKRYVAISATVAARADYFPADAEVEVIYHPSTLECRAPRAYNYIFTASRLDAAKRLDLIIKAFRQVRTDVELRIAGTGPAEAELRKVAEGDPRIRFIGFCSDDELAEHYADARCVVFVPYDEDYGLITVEAMRSGKAVITVTDSGGVNELVEHGVTGLSVEPNAEALATAMRRLLDDSDAAMSMGRAAQQRVAHVNWRETVQSLVRTPSRPRGVRRTRHRTLVVVDFPVHPPRGGGQSRVFHFYKALAERTDVTILSLTPEDRGAGSYDLAPGLRELRIAKTPQHLAAERRLEVALGASVADVAALLYQALTPEYATALAELAARTDLVVASHPYLYPALEALQLERLWYEAHNVELDMKRSVLADSAHAEPYLLRVKDAEAALCERAERVLVCSQRDARRLHALYALSKARTTVVPNGVDAADVRYVGGAERRTFKQRLGLARRSTALFVGAWHQPNIEAAQALKRIAARCPDWDFMVVGSVSSHPGLEDRPHNLHPLGVLDDRELQILTAAVDLALNPVISGSGTNLKMLQYAAVGAPILTTEFGNRGLGFRPGEHLLQAPLEDFPAAIERFLEETDVSHDVMTRQARRMVERDYDWRVIADRVALG